MNGEVLSKERAVRCGVVRLVLGTLCTYLLSYLLSFISLKREPSGVGQSRLSSVPRVPIFSSCCPEKCVARMSVRTFIGINRGGKFQAGIKQRIKADRG